MRIIGGSAGGQRLRAPRNSPIRPTTDYLKEAMFAMIESLLAWGRPNVGVGTVELWQGLRVLDVYAGSGALGIEALSRGAAEATFLEAERRALAAIRANLDGTGLAGRASVVPGDVSSTLGLLRGPIDLALFDPPYGDVAGFALAARLAASRTIAADAIVAFEHGRRVPAPDTLGALAQQRHRRYGDTMLTLYARGRFDRAGQRGSVEVS